MAGWPVNGPGENEERKRENEGKERNYVYLNAIIFSLFLLLHGYTYLYVIEYSRSVFGIVGVLRTRNFFLGNLEEKVVNTFKVVILKLRRYLPN